MFHHPRKVAFYEGIYGDITIVCISVLITTTLDGVHIFLNRFRVKTIHIFWGLDNLGTIVFAVHCNISQLF